MFNSDPKGKTNGLTAQRSFQQATAGAKRLRLGRICAPTAIKSGMSHPHKLPLCPRVGGHRPGARENPPKTPKSPIKPHQTPLNHKALANDVTAPKDSNNLTVLAVSPLKPQNAND